MRSFRRCFCLPTETGPVTDGLVQGRLPISNPRNRAGERPFEDSDSAGRIPGGQQARVSCAVSGYRRHFDRPGRLDLNQRVVTHLAQFVIVKWAETTQPGTVALSEQEAVATLELEDSAGVCFQDDLEL